MESVDGKIPVARPFFPPREEYAALMDRVWDAGWVTNQGPLLHEFESALGQSLGLQERVRCVANGGLALQIGLRALGVEGAVLTTPFSYVATTSCPLWEKLPVQFADIEADYLTLDPAAVEASIDSSTEAILATHVYGYPCDVEALEVIAQKHKLALLYDAAQTFGTRYMGKSLMSYGDLSILSLHATKLLHSVEGGAIFARDPLVEERVEWMRRFGHDGHESFHGVGMNAKMSEMHAAMGLCVLKHVDSLISNRAKMIQYYRDGLSGVAEYCRIVEPRAEAEPNHAYAPVLFCDEAACLRVLSVLKDHGILARRYFYPTLERLSEAGTSWEIPIAQDYASRVLCLPLYEGLPREMIERICESVKMALHQTKGGA